MFERLIHLNPESKHSIFLFGPRGTGKTSWLRTHFSEAIYFDLLNDEVYNRLLTRPNRLAELIPTNYSGWIIIDEVQKIPTILDEVHRLIESRSMRFILTGSSARKLKQKGVNLLAGRALNYYMHPLTKLEVGNQFNFDNALSYGLLPMAVTSDEVKKYLASYITNYLREEVFQEGLTRNAGLFHQFLETASFSQAEVLNYTAISREISSSRKTVTNFFDILDDLLIARRLPVFNKRAQRDLINAQKFFYFDVGVYRAIRPIGPLDSTAEIDGAALETLFLQHATAYNDYFDLGYSFYYWHTRTHQEVDFVLYGNNGLHAFEIKCKSRIDNKDLKALKLFAKDYPEAELYLLYGGNESYHDNNINIVPFEESLQYLPQWLTPTKR